MTITAATNDEEVLASALQHLEQLIAFDTTSRNSNLALIGYVEDQLSSWGAAGVRVAAASGDKANLFVRLGPEAPGGVVLSGHTDVVPVDGQPWTTDPFKLTRQDERYYGRGVADMKSFLALSLAIGPAILQHSARPAYLAFSYDEEVGCLGAPAMIEEMARLEARPSLVIVGEPTMMKVVQAHKGLAAFRVVVHGREAHSSLPDQGASANMAAIELLTILGDIARDLTHRAPTISSFVPPYSTLTVGLINGGSAVNILARECTFAFDLRMTPEADEAAILQPFYDGVADLHRRLRARGSDLGLEVERLAAVPPLAAEPDGRAESLVRALTGDNAPSGVVSFAAEAGQFQRSGMSTVICGPGSIAQAHIADEYIDIDQLRQGAKFMIKLAHSLS